jgi:hypothetical protein
MRTKTLKVIGVSSAGETSLFKTDTRIMPLALSGFPPGSEPLFDQFVSDSHSGKTLSQGLD